jgi:beta-N-acetylhexosaminidase
MEDPAARYRASVMRRRVVAGIAVVAIAGAAWLVLIGDDSTDRPTTIDLPRDVSPQSGILAQQLTPEQLVDQVLLIGFDGTVLDAPLTAELAERQVGGVVVGPQNWAGAGPGAALTGTIRKAGSTKARIPPLIVAAQEGGRYRSFADLPPQQTELQIGETDSVGAAESWALQTGRALRRSGFDLNLFPVADVATLDSPVADRAFSDDPAVAAEMTAAAVRGCRRAGIGCAPLHFPGLGAASQDTDAGPATVSLDPASLDSRDLRAFRAAFAERAPAVILSLALYAAYDPVTPGALAEPIATGLLRDRLGFDGLAITDDLDSGAVRASYSVSAAAVAAIQAGADMVQIDSPDRQDAVRQALLDAVEGGDIPEARMREAAGRVLELKRELGLLTAQ